MQETVNDVMSKKVVAVLPGDTLEEAARLMKEHDVGVLPVVSGGELKGLVTDRDIVLQCVAAGKEPSQVKAYQIMTKDVVSVSPGQTVSEAARLMGKEQIRRLPVLKDGVIDGMISMADIARRHAGPEVAAAISEISEPFSGIAGAVRTRGFKEDGLEARTPAEGSPASA